MTIHDLIERLQSLAADHGGDTEVYVTVPDDAGDYQDGPATDASFSIGRVFIASNDA